MRFTVFNRNDFIEADQRDSPCPVPKRKIFLFPFDPNHRLIPAVPSHKGAARDRHERGTGCGGRGCADDEQRVMRTAKSCGPDAPALASSSREAHFLGATVTTKPVTEESTKVPPSR